MRTFRLTLLSSLLLLLLLPSAGAVDQSPLEPARGVLLIAGEQINDPRFRQGELLLVQHDVRGSAALVLNRRSRLPLAEVVGEDSKFSRSTLELAYGGPVEPTSLLALVSVRKNPPHPADKIFDGVYLTALSVLEDWPDFAGEVIDVRVFVGFCGWAQGQLLDEIERGDWSLVAADRKKLFAGD